MIFKVKWLFILYIASNDCIFSDLDVNEQMQSENQGKRYLEIDSVGTHRYALPDHKKFCTCTRSNQGLNESSTSMENQNIIRPSESISCLSSFSSNYFEKNDNINIQNRNEIVQNIHHSITDKPQDIENNLNGDTAIMNTLTHSRVADTTLPDEMLGTSNTVVFINSEELIQNVVDQEYTTDNYKFVDKKGSNDESDISITVEDIEDYLRLSEYNNIESNGALNPQIKGLIGDQNCFSQEEIIILIKNINETEQIQTTNTIVYEENPETNICHEDISDGLIINLNETETTIFIDKGKCLNVNEILEGEQASQNDKPMDEFNIFKLLKENPSIRSHTEEPEKNNQIFCTPYFTMLENINLDNLRVEETEKPLLFMQEHESVSNTTYSSNIYEKVKQTETLPFNKSVFKQTGENSQIIEPFTTENLLCVNNEVNEAPENSISTKCVFMHFLEDNKIFKGRCIKYYEFGVLYERAGEKKDLKRSFKEIPDFSSKNSNKCFSTQIESETDIKKLIEDQINFELQMLYFDNKTCVNLFSFNENYKKGIFIFKLSHTKIQTIPLIKLRKYSVDCICDGNKYFKHDIYYFSNVPLFIYPHIFLHAHVRFWSVKRLYHSSRFNFILSICVERKSLKSIQVGWETFDIEKYLKKYVTLFLLRLRNLYIPILERNPPKKIFSLNFNSTVIQSSAFRVEKKYISLNNFLEKKYEELIRTIKDNKDLIWREINEESIRNQIDLMLKYAEDFYENYKNILNYVKTPGEDINEGLLLINKMAADINSCKLSLLLRKDFSSEEIELMSFCSAVEMRVCDFIKQNTPDLL